MSRSPSFAAHLVRRVASRGTAHVIIPVALAAVALSAVGAGLMHRASPTPEAAAGDTVVLYGPHRFEAPHADPGAQPTVYNFPDSFSLNPNPTHRYLLRITNGEPDGSARVENGTVNGTPVDAHTGVKTVEITTRPTGILVVSLVGQHEPGHLGVEILEITGGKILVFGMERFTRGKGPAVGFTRMFAVEHNAGSPFALWIMNGNADGAQRLNGVTVTLNGDTVVGTLPQLIADSAILTRPVSPVNGQNQLTITLPPQSPGYIEIGVTATDITPPTLTIATPAPGFITRDTIVNVSGTVGDASVAVTVNGVKASRTGVNYAAMVALTEGPNRLAISAVSASGSRADSTRSVIRDRHSPILKLTAPADRFVSSDVKISVSGTVSDLSSTTVNVNGVPLPIDGTGAFSGSAPLVPGSNILTVTAADAAGNTTSLLRTGTRTGLPTGVANLLSGITHTLLTSGTSATNATVYTTASIAPAANTLITVAVMGRRSTGAVTPTISGGGMTTWTQVASVTYDVVGTPLSQVTVFRALSSSPGSGTLTITFPSTESNATWIVSQWSGVETSGTNGDGAIAQYVSARGDAVTSLSATLSAFGNSSNVAYGVVGVGKNGPAVNPGTGFTEIAEPSSGETNLLEAEYGANLTNVSANWSGASNAGLLALEIRVAGSGGSAVIAQSLLTSGSDTTNQTVYTTASISPAANALITVAVMSRRAYGAETPAISGGGMTSWTLVAGVDYDPVSGPLSRISVFRAMRSSPGSGPLTITFPDNQSNATWIVSQWTGVDTSGTGAGAIVQIASTRGDAVSSISKTLAALANVNDVAFGIVGANLNGPAVTPGSGFTEIAEPTSGENNLLEAEWGISLTNVSMSLTTAKNAGLLAFEIKATGASGGVFAAQSTVSASPTSILAGSGSSTITVTAKDAAGNPVSGATVVLTATGGGNTITQPSGTTNASGVTTGTLSSSVAETKTISATANGISITQTATVTVTPAGAGITHTLLTSGFDATNTTVYTTASIAPAANALITVAVLGKRSTGAQTPTITGGGMSSWTLVASIDYDPISGPLSRVSVFRALSSAPGSGALTITFPNTQSNGTWIVSQWSGVDVTGTNGSGAILQNASARGDAVTSLSTILNAFGNSINAAFGVVGVGMNGPVVTPGTGLTEIAEPTSGESNLLEAEWGLNRTNVSASWTSAKNAGLLAFEIRAAPGGGFPPPSAPPVDPTVATTIGSATNFLYTGANPVQTGVAPGAIDPVRVAVLRGQVMTRDSQPLPGTVVSVVGHPEFGSTQVRDNGWYDMAVNGGQRLTLNFAKTGFLTGQRSTEPLVQDYNVLSAVALVPSDANVTVVDFSSPVQVARGSSVTDTSGTRQATLLFKQGTAATMTLPNGTVQPLSTLHVRATEFTVGPNGAAAMPGELPSNSGYTYAVDLSVDEAQAAGATNVQFSKAVPVYVDNFLGFAVGVGVPVGYYDPQQAQWIPSDNGRVIKIMSVSGGVASIDITGDDVADDATTLAGIGIDMAEQQSLGSLYSAGKTLWRASVTHFSPRDFNWPFGFPDDALNPENSLVGNNRTNCPGMTGGSVIECETQALGEELGLAGTPFSLHYRSSRVAGNAAERTIRIPLTGASIPASLRRIERRVYIAGRMFSNSYTPATSLTSSFTWDGLDAYGRPAQGLQAVRVLVGYVYDAVYKTQSQVSQQFAQFGGNATAIRCRGEIVAWQELSTSLGAWGAESFGLGGWTLSVLHAYDPGPRTLFQGDGRRRDADNLSRIITTVAGTGPTGGGGDFGGDGGPATAARFNSPVAVAVGPDGSLYISDYYNARIRRVSPSGIVTTVAGNGDADYSGDGGPATQAGIGFPNHLDVGPDGSIYFGAWDIPRIRKVDPSGIITTVAGSGTKGFSGDGGPATSAMMWSDPPSIIVDPDGGFYFIDNGDFSAGGNQRIRRVNGAGLISTVAGNGLAGFSGDNGPASSAQIYNPLKLSRGPDGAVYIADVGNSRVRRIGRDGIIRTVLGTGLAGYSGDGGPATQANVSGAEGIVLGPDGLLYVADWGINRIRVIGSNGIITTIAGNGVAGFSGDSGPAVQAQLGYPTDVALGPDGSLYIVEPDNHRVRRVGPPVPGFAATDIAIASKDGRELYQFDQYGRHLRTRDATTGAVLLTFGYDGAGLVDSVTDANNNITTVERDAQGSPTAIVGPFGQRTSLTLNGAGYLASVTDPGGNVVRLFHDSTGILDSLADPRGYTHRFTYDSLGRLRRDDDPAGGYKTLALTETDTNWTVPLTTALGRTTSYRIDRTSFDGTRRVVTDPAGLTSTSVSDPANRETVQLLPGDSVRTASLPEPRWGMQAPTSDSVTYKTPGGLVATLKIRSHATISDPNDPLSLVSETDSVSRNGQWKVSTYTASTRHFVATSPEGRQTFATLDAKGRVVEAQTAGLDSVMYTYDSRGRLSQEQIGGRIWTYDYDSRGRLLGTLNPLGLRDSLFYDDADRLTRRVLPGSRVVTFGYDSSGNLTHITPAGHSPHTFTYSPVDLAGSYTPPNVGLTTPGTSYQYNADRQITQITRPDSLTVIFGYESTTGRPSTLTFDRGTMSYGYNSMTGNLESITAPGSNTLTFTYDGALPKTATWAGTVAGSVGVTYNNDLRVIGQTVDGANSVSFSYDRDGLLTQAGALGLKRHAQHGLLERDSIGNVLGVWGYDPKGALASYAASYSGSTLFQTGYTRDSLGRIAQLTETIQGTTTTRTFTYDSAGRLASVSENSVLVRSYSYDANGNRLSLTGPGISISGTYDAQDRLLSYGSTSYTYGSNGDLKTKTVLGVGTTTYTYDALGNLVTVLLPDGTRIDYVIDGLSRRVGRKLNGVLVQAWLYQNQLNPVAELDGSGSVVSRFVYASRTSVPDYVIKNGIAYRIIADHLGSARLVVNTTTGVVAQRIDYDEWGNVSQNTNPGFQPFGFGGGIQDTQTGLVRFGARDYDPLLGRWVVKDPLGFAGGDLNLYAYAGFDPVNHIDPSGNQPPLWAAIIAAGGVINGVFDAIEAAGSCNPSLLGVLGAFGRGFVAGAAGTTVSLIGTAVGNPVLGGAVGGAVGTAIEGKNSPGELALGAATGGFFGTIGGRMFPTVGEEPNLYSPRSLSQYGKNSIRKIAQEGAGDILAGTSNILSRYGAGMPGENPCQCDH